MENYLKCLIIQHGSSGLQICSHITLNAYSKKDFELNIINLTKDVIFLKMEHGTHKFALPSANMVFTHDGDKDRYIGVGIFDNLLHFILLHWC
jgi:hypothetical protein